MQNAKEAKVTKVTCKSRSFYMGLRTRVSLPQLERKRMLLAVTLVCAKAGSLKDPPWFREQRVILCASGVEEKGEIRWKKGVGIRPRLWRALGLPSVNSGDSAEAFTRGVTWSVFWEDNFRTHEREITGIRGWRWRQSGSDWTRPRLCSLQTMFKEQTGKWPGKEFPCPSSL